MAKERHPVAFMVGAVLGGAAGAIFGLMNAPRPGPETRADLTERWHDVEERAAQEIAHLESEVRDRVGQGQDQSTELEIEVTIDRPPQA
jgi:gas vesicle protein